MKIIANLNKFYCRPRLVFLHSFRFIARLMIYKSISLLHILRSESAGHFTHTKRHKLQSLWKLLKRTWDALFWCMLSRRCPESDSKHRNYRDHNLLCGIEVWDVRWGCSLCTLTASFQSTWRIFRQKAYKKKLQWWIVLTFTDVLNMSFKGKQSWFCSSPSAPVLETVLHPSDCKGASIHSSGSPVLDKEASWRRLHELYTLCVILFWGEQEPGFGRLDWGRSWAVDT